MNESASSPFATQERPGVGVDPRTSTRAYVVASLTGAVLAALLGGGVVWLAVTRIEGVPNMVATLGIRLGSALLPAVLGGGLGLFTVQRSKAALTAGVKPMSPAPIIVAALVVFGIGVATLLASFRALANAPGGNETAAANFVFGAPLLVICFLAWLAVTGLAVSVSYLTTRALARSLLSPTSNARSA